jgi:CRP-like cAMP-binding protein
MELIMGQSATATRTSANLLLAALPPRDFEIVSRHLEQAPLQLKRVIYDPDQVIEHVYFPESGMVSLLGVLTDGTAVETASTGREGMVGMPIFHRTDRIAEQAVVQLPGSALRMTAEALRECLTESKPLEDLLHRYAASIFMLAAQSIACMSKHDTQRRLARWLLHASDQSGTARLELTHIFAAQMLGVRRSSVTVAAGALRAKGLITYTRRHLIIVDKPKLEQASCECYHIIRSTYDRLLFGKTSENPNARVKASRDGMTILNAPHPEDAARDPVTRMS